LDSLPPELVHIIDAWPSLSDDASWPPRMTTARAPRSPPRDPQTWRIL